MNPRHQVLTRLAGGLALSLAILGCQPARPPAAAAPPTPVTVSLPVVREVIDHDYYEGRISTVLKVDLRTRSRGFLVKVALPDGGLVESGKLLFQIDPRPYKVALEAAEAMEKGAVGALEYAKSEYDRTRKLAMERAASRTEMEMWQAKQIVAQSDRLKAEASIKQAALDLEFAQIRAPFTGKLSRTQVDEGTLVNSGGGDTLLSTIVSTGPVYVYFNIDERSLIRYRRDFGKKKGADGKELPVADLHIPVHVALEGETGYPHTGVIDYADPKVDSGTGTLEVRGKLPNKTGMLQDGMRARVRVPVSDPYKATQISERAIGNEQGRKFVYVVNKDDVIERRDVILDRLVDGMQSIRAGIDPEDRIIVSGINRVREGQKVAPKVVAMPGTTPVAPKTDATDKK